MGTITNDKGRLSKEDIEKMVSDAEKYKADDDKAKERVSSRNELESYAYQMKQTIDDDKLKDKITDDDKKKIKDKSDEAISWFDNNQTAEKDEYDAKKKELEQLCMPIMTKLYQEGGAPGGAPGGMPGGMPGGFPGAGGAGAGGAGAGASSGGPTIEEVD